MGLVLLFELSLLLVQAATTSPTATAAATILTRPLDIVSLLPPWSPGGRRPTYRMMQTFAATGC